jgi:4-methylaminobutanoate oxidase (formaldehyde-forming)
VSGPGAASFLEKLCDNRVAREVGKITYTQMLNRRGGIEADFTVSRLAEDRFGIVTGTAFGRHDLAWIQSHMPADGSGDVRVEDVTSRWACMGLWGPRARDVLAGCTAADLDFPYMSLRELWVGDVPVRALRVTYVGELGWELYCPTEFGAALWQAVWEAGEPHGLVAGGYRAIDSLRLEKGYRVWGADITPDETPWEGGVGFCVKLDKGDFIGREALLAARGHGVERQLCCLVLDDREAVRGRQRAGHGRRRRAGAGDQRGVRVHRRSVDRLRLPAGGALGARDRRRGRDLRRLDRGPGGRRAPV